MSVVKETALELANVIGHVEKNLASYDRIKARYRRKRIAKRIDEILVKLVELRPSQTHLLFALGEILDNREDDEILLQRVKFMLHNSKDESVRDLREFLILLLSLRDFV